jgi:hypothetical protein
MLSYSYLNNDHLPKTGTVNIPYRATSHDTVAGTPSSTSLDVVTGTAAPVAITFTTSDGYPASNLAANLTALPPGWSTTSSGCATVSPASPGTPCLLNLTYAPTVPTTGTPALVLPFTYTDNSGRTAQIGVPVNIAYRATSNNTVAGTANPNPLNVLSGAGATPVVVTFITNDTYPASNLSVNLTGLPAGWTATSSGICATVSAGSPCQLTLTYTPPMAPTTSTGTFGLPFTYTNNSGTGESGTASITYNVAP